jgi:hypothetical protein
MKAIQKLLDTTTKKIIAIGLLLILITWVVLFFAARDMAISLVKPLLWTLLLVAVTWLCIHFGVKAWRKRKRSEFDQQVAAKEGIEDRRREWMTWTSELEKQGIDRYELPFYLLVGEPQSGKSVLLHNSDLHFPFGQNRLSGVGGTRGCDWWFTEEAVILDLAGRLFTHEGGAVDRLEFEAFLQLLYEFRPLCPVNGVLLVIPCNSLLQDSAEECGAKATKIQNALLTLTTQLQAQLPVYLVLTKGDQIFGFAECVHRLDVERRHQMFGWSRPAEKIDTPFDEAEVTAGFQEMVQRARLLRSHMTAGARLPEGLPEVDRMYAFPHELEGMQQNLEIYLKKVFTSSNIIDRVFFRGLYLTSGLQSGVPIAKVCTQLFGQAGEADRRSLEALFSKPRAYFIKDLIRTRVFGERGLVRPTQGRVQQTRRTSVVGYGLSGALVLASVVFAAVYLLKGVGERRQTIYDQAIEGVETVLKAPGLPIPGLLHRLQQVNDAIEVEPDTYEKTFTDPRENLKLLYCELFNKRLVPAVKHAALDGVEKQLTEGLNSHEELRTVCDGLGAMLGDLDFSSSDTRKAVLACLPNYSSGRTTVEGGTQMLLDRSFQLRMDYGESAGLMAQREEGEAARLVRLARMAIAEVERSLEPGSPTQPGRELGFMLAWFGAERAHAELTNGKVVQSGRALELASSFHRSMEAMKRIESEQLTSGGGGKPIKFADVLLQARPLQVSYRESMISFVEANDTRPAPQVLWPAMNNLLPFVKKKFEGHEGPFNLSSLGAHFGSEDLGQTIFQESETAIGGLTGQFVLGVDHKPSETLDDPAGLLDLCAQAPPADLRNGNLAGLAENLSTIHTGVLGQTSTGHTAEVFKAFCIELGDIFKRELTTPEEATQAVLGAEQKVQRGELAVPLVDELASLHDTVRKILVDRELTGTVRDKLIQWLDAMESVLYAHLGASESASEWMSAGLVEGDFSPEAWNVLEILSKAAKLELVPPHNNPVTIRAAEVQRSAFFQLADELILRWQERPSDNLVETSKTVEELSKLAKGVKERLGDSSGLDVGGGLASWAGRVDTVLLDRLRGVAGELERLWTPSPGSGSLAQVIHQSLQELNLVQKKIDDSNNAGMASLGPILKDLGQGGTVTTWLTLPQTSEVVATLQGWKIPANRQQVETEPEYKELKGVLERFAISGGNDDQYGEFLASEYVDRFSAPLAGGAAGGAAGAGPPKAAEHAGLTLVRLLRENFKRSLCQEIRTRYLVKLEELLDESRYRTLFAVLFSDLGEDFPRDSDVEVRDALNSLLDRKQGDLFKLQKKFRLAGDGKVIASEVFPEKPGADAEGWAGVHLFLVRLQDFLLGEGTKNIRSAKFNFWIIPQTGSSGSVWAPGSPQDRRGNFYYPGNNSSEDLQKETMGGDMGRLKVADWGFETSRPDRKLLLVWSDLPVQSEARTDSNRYFHEVPSCLAPLLLAWSGTPRDEDEPLEFDVSFTPTRSNLPAPMRLEFENPLPLRPVRP